MFLFPIILFDSTGDVALNNKLIPLHQSNFTQLLEHFVYYHVNGNDDLAAIRFGVMLDITYRFLNI